MSSRLSKNCFQVVGCLPFSQLVEKVKYNATLTKFFATQLKRDKVTIACIYFTISTDILVEATCMPNHGETWFKNQDLALQNYQPYLIRHHQQYMKNIFIVGHLLEKYTPLMKIIMKYSTSKVR